MLKNNAFRRLLLATLSLLIVLIIYFFPSKTMEEKDNIIYINSLKSPIYLLDKNNYVSRINVLKNGNSLEENIRSLIADLTIDDKSSIYLPESFSAIIPKNTKIKNLSIDKNLLKIDFSKELLNVEAEYEEKLIEAIVYTLTEFDSIDQVMIFVEGVRLMRLPHSQKILPLTLDRDFGINKTYNISSFKDVNKTTTYYMAKANDFNYYIPITTIDNNPAEKIQIIIKNLQTSPINQTNLTSFLASTASLNNYEILENSINLSFNNSLVTNINDEALIEEVKYSIFLSLKDSYNIKSVLFEIPDKAITILN